MRGFENQPLLLLHHKGAKTGTERINPLAYLEVGDAYAIFASKGGSHQNPDWFHNIKANPDVTIEVGNDTMKAVARVTEGDERERIWEEQKAFNHWFATYEERTNRDHIPVVLLEPAG